MTRFNWQHAVALAVALLMAPALSQAAESYDNCTGYIDAVPAVLTTQGTWCLRHDVATSIASGTAITVATNNVTIDCNDFKLGGLAAGAGTAATGIGAVNRFNTTVRHCNVRGFFYGLSFSGGGHAIEDNRFDGNTYEAMDIEGDGSVIRRNRVFDTGGSTQTTSATGIFAVNSADVMDNVVSGVTASGNGFAIGINVQSNGDGTIEGNHVRELVSDGSGAGGATAGIFSNATGTSGRIALRGNDVVGDSSTGSQGISCTGIVDTTNGRMKDNVISGFASGNVGCSDDGGNVVVP